MKVRALSSTGETLYWFVNMYAPWCSHCVKAAPEYKVAAERMDGEVEFGAINCVDNVKAAAPLNKSLFSRQSADSHLSQRFRSAAQVCKDKWGIRSYPTLMMISPRCPLCTARLQSDQLSHSAVLSETVSQTGSRNSGGIPFISLWGAGMTCTPSGRTTWPRQANGRRSCRRCASLSLSL